jgi:hypothetical protein
MLLLWGADAVNAHLTSSSPERREPMPQTARAFGKTIAAFVAIGVVMAGLLWETRMPWNEHGGDGGGSLNLSKPIFIKGALCPYQGLLASFSDANAQGCLNANTESPVAVVATATNGVLAQVFKVDIETPEGPVEGWVTSGSLRN